MASLSSTLRTTIVAVGVIASSLSFIAPASAASPHHAKSHRRLCDGRAEARRALARAIRHAPPHPVVIHQVTPRVQRGLPQLHAREHDAAIQNDSVAIYAEPDRLRSTLQPAWLLADPQDLLPRNQRYSRRSPRGPPVSI